MITTIHKEQAEFSFQPAVIIPTTLLGYDYDIQISCWDEGLTAYRFKPSSRQEKIEGGIGIGLDFIDAGESKTKWLSLIPEGLIEQTTL
jgi:hypothetical protein